MYSIQKLTRHFTFFSYSVFEIRGLLYTHRASQFRLAAFQALSSHTAALLDRAQRPKETVTHEVERKAGVKSHTALYTRVNETESFSLKREWTAVFFNRKVIQSYLIFLKGHSSCSVMSGLWGSTVEMGRREGRLMQQCR